MPVSTRLMKWGGLIGVVSFCIGAMIFGSAQAQTAEPPPMQGIQDRLAPPPTVDPPTQADLGAQMYYQVCMVCHGDRGQGLTDEWRSVLDPPDQNCWQSRCHATNHPPEGFIFPKLVPAVVGEQIVTRFLTAKQLHDYIVGAMPWQAPGSRSAAEYWQLTAFLLRLNGVKQPYENLDEANAGLVFLKPISPATPAPLSGSLDNRLVIIIGFLGILIVLLLARIIWMRAKSFKS